MYQNNTLRFSNCYPVPMSDLPAVNEQLRKELLFFEATAEKPGTAGAILRIMRDAHLTVGKLIEGIMLTCDDIDQLIGVEAQTVEASKNFQRYLTFAATFGRETVIDLEPGDTE